MSYLEREIITAKEIMQNSALMREALLMNSAQMKALISQRPFGLEFAARAGSWMKSKAGLKTAIRSVTKKEASDGKKNRPEMQAANQYREKPDFKPASVKTPVIAANFNPGVCWGYPTISRLTYENFVGEESTYTKSAGQPFGSIPCWLAEAKNFSLPYSENACYLLPVSAKSVTGRENPCMLLATPDAIFNRVFFLCRRHSASIHSGHDPHRVNGGAGGAAFGLAGFQ